MTRRLTNIEPALGTLVGRGALLADLGALAPFGPMCLSLVGLGGVGKSRVARAFAELCGGAFRERWWCAVGKGAQGMLDGPALERAIEAVVPGLAAGGLAAALAQRPGVLLVLDGVERLDAGGRALVERLSRRSFVLTTGDGPLGIDGEQCRVVGPLTSDAAVELLRRRSEAAGMPSGAVDAEELAALAAALDHLPLCIELAAPWLAALEPSALLARLSRPHEILKPLGEGGTGDWAAAMARCLGALGDEERASLSVLAAFETSFDLSAAAAVLGDDEASVLRVARLTRRGVLLREGSDRYRLPRTLRAYVRAGWSPEERVVAYAAHARFVIGPPAERTPLGQRADWTASDVEAHRDEIVAVVARYSTTGAEAAVQAALVATPTLTSETAWAQEAARLSALAAELPGDAQLLRAQICFALGRGLLVTHGDVRSAAESFEAGVAACDARAGAPAPLRVALLEHLGWARVRHGARAAAVVALEEAVAVSQRTEADKAVTARLLLAAVHMQRVEFAQARACFLEARRVARALGTPRAAVAVAVWHARLALDVPGMPAPPGRLPLEGSDPRQRASFDVMAAGARAFDGEVEAARAGLLRALDGADMADDTGLRCVRDAWLGMLDVAGPRPADGRVGLATAIEFLEAARQPAEAMVFRLWWAIGVMRTGHHAAAREHLEQLDVDTRRTEALFDTAINGLFLAVARAHGGAFEEAWRALGDDVPDAMRDVAKWVDGAALATVLVGWLEGRARDARSAGDEAWLREALAPFRRRRAGRSGRLGLIALTLLAIAEDALDASEWRPLGEVPRLAAPRGPVLLVAEDWSWCAVGDDGPRVRLARRKVMRSVLQALVTAHATGGVLSLDAVLAAGWPGQRMQHASAVARVHTMLWRLREAGLRTLLVTTDEGYRLAPAVQVTWRLPTA